MPVKEEKTEKENPKFLTMGDINKVHPKLRETVKKALKKGENVPYGVINIRFSPITGKDIQRVRELSKQYGWEFDERCIAGKSVVETPGLDI
jgi:hypothetical protein